MPTLVIGRAEQSNRIKIADCLAFDGFAEERGRIWRNGSRFASGISFGGLESVLRARYLLTWKGR
jgi:hypothetical protein